jgi:cytoskeletal protein CcmA (bactofilin family)
MFKKTEDTSASPAASASARGGPAASTARGTSVIGPTLVFKGELSADEDLIIEGKIEGTIAHHKKNLTVGKQGRVKADIHASRVTIEGSVDGDIHGDEIVLLAPTAHVNGNIFAPRIKIDDGATFNGKVQMGQRQPQFSVAEAKGSATGSGA